MRKFMHERNNGLDKHSEEYKDIAYGIKMRILALIIAIEGGVMGIAGIQKLADNFFRPATHVSNQSTPTRRTPITTLPGSNGIDNPVTITNTGAAGSGHTRRQ